MSILMWVGIVAGALVLVLVVLPVSWLLIAGSKADGVAVDIEAPDRIPPEQPFEIVVTIRNQLDRPRVLRSIDFDSSLLKGFAIDTIDPEPHDQSSLLATTTFYYKKLPIPPRGSTTARLRARSLAIGEYTGTIAVFVDRAHTNSQDTPFRIFVGAGPSHRHHTHSISR